MDFRTPLLGIDIALTATILVCFYVIATVIYRVLFHPLASYPGPFLGKFLEHDSMGSIFSKDRTMKQYNRLKKYGSPYRASTNTLVFSDLKSFSDIYGQHSRPCLKDHTFYDFLSVTGAQNILNASVRHEHAQIRRILAHSFSERSLLESEAVIAERVRFFVDHVFGSQKPGEPVDILRSTHNHFLDIVSLLSFGRSLDCLKGQNPTAYEDLEEFSNALVPTLLFAQSFAPKLAFLLRPFLKKNFQGLARLEQFSRTSVMGYLTDFRHRGSVNMPRTFLRNLVMAEDPETGTKLTDDELVENAILFLRAGSSTTAVTVVYCLWACGKNPAIMQKVITEVREAFPDPSEVPTYEKASKLTYLNCAIEETLRLFGTLNVSLPRISPGRTLADRYIPAGVVVATNPYATARDPSAFPDPESFIPDRWLKPTPEMRALSRPFSYGPRNCIGKHLAEIGLNVTLARIYQLYEVTVDPRTTDAMMQQRDNGVIDPVGEHLWVRVKPRI